MSQRIEQINELIRKTISELMIKNLSFKEGVFVTVTKVDTSKDFRYTRVFISVFPEKEIHYVEKTLIKEIFDLQRELNKKLHMKPLPRVEFRLDMTESKADEIEKLLRQL
jgi:ribosome-binding factor A